MPDKRFWWIKLKALAATHNWEGLEAFAKSKKSPIGYEPFVVSRRRASVERSEARVEMAMARSVSRWRDACS